MQYVKIFTSESVSEGHPDKVADQISDAILDAILEHDANSRVACETFVSTGLVLIGGEITTTAWINMEKLARQVVKEIGYDNPELGFDWQSCAVLVAVGEQSPDIAMGVNETSGHEQGAGDQGIMFGYASDETDVLMPAPIVYAHRLMQRQAELRKSGQISWLRPDAKSQVTLDYNDKGQPISVDTVVISTQHSPDVSHSEIEEAVIEEIIKPVLPAQWLTKNTKYYVNPTGRFVIGGPQGDCGMTGRKIIVDSYGGKAHHGGGAFSGKDPSKVDRSGSYAARYVAKNIVAAGLACRCELQISYAIGVAEPISICVDTFGTGKVPDQRIAEIICEVFDLRPKSIVAMLNLKTPIYRPTAAYGHFGRTEDTFHWERTDKVEALKKAVG